MTLFADDTPAPGLQQLSTEITVVWVLAGILISLVLPLAVKVLKQASTGLEEATTRPPTFWERVVRAWDQYAGQGARYALVLASAVLIAVVIVFLLGLKFYSARDAALAGFAWESFINKLFGRQKPAS